MNAINLHGFMRHFLSALDTHRAGIEGWVDKSEEEKLKNKERLDWWLKSGRLLGCCSMGITTADDIVTAFHDAAREIWPEFEPCDPAKRADLDEVLVTVASLVDTDTKPGIDIDELESEKLDRMVDFVRKYVEKLGVVGATLRLDFYR